MHFCATILYWIIGSHKPSDMSHMVLLEKLMVRKYIWLNIFNVLLHPVSEQPCVRLRGGQCFSPQKIPSFETEKGTNKIGKLSLQSDM